MTRISLFLPTFLLLLILTAHVGSVADLGTRAGADSFSRAIVLLGGSPQTVTCSLSLLQEALSFLEFLNVLPSGSLLLPFDSFNELF